MRLSTKQLMQAIKDLPDAQNHPEDIVRFKGFEPFDPNAEERPTTATYRTIYFEKNIERNGWNFVVK